MNRITDYGKLATDIITWIKAYATTNNIKSLVVGVSGGIDSAVVSTLCARTGLPVYTSYINVHSQQDHFTRSVKHINWLKQQFGDKVHGGLWDMSPVMDAFTEVLDASDLHDHSLANTRSRIRMMSLYYLAGHTDGIVVGTGNKVEDFGVGFYTKYGDGGVDISPIADLYKTEVRELAKYLGINQEIIDAAPTDGLWADGRTDEDQIGATYEELEWAMDYRSKFMWSGLTPRQVEVMDIYDRLNKQNQHKMQPIPIYKLNQ